MKTYWQSVAGIIVCNHVGYNIVRYHAAAAISCACHSFVSCCASFFVRCSFNLFIKLYERKEM
ncbi:hypothetical protein P5738_02635 [Bacillus cereus]|uniref:hypothetical protein n=1 Tax=Bacillus cereus TaxID=1396 RepID=UPI0024050318|nr:hypothetical protein [Bacillus cereus]MDF9480445.1 hypothetical protein [Bacillus cereus]